MVWMSVGPTGASCGGFRIAQESSEEEPDAFDFECYGPRSLPSDLNLWPEFKSDICKYNIGMQSYIIHQEDVIALGMDDEDLKRLDLLRGALTRRRRKWRILQMKAKQSFQLLDKRIGKDLANIVMAMAGPLHNKDDVSKWFPIEPNNI